MKKKSVILLSVFFVLMNSSLSFGKSTEINLKQEELKKINVFFSNFSETFLMPFEKNQITNKELIEFGIFHNLLNNHQLFQPYKSSYLRIDKKYIQVSIEKYFGITKIVHENVGDAIYENGYYLIPEGDGEVCAFSQVVKFVDIGNSYFVAYLNIYNVGSGFTGEPNGNIKTWNEARDGDIPELACKMKATVKKVISNNNSSRYILIDYLEVQ